MGYCVKGHADKYGGLDAVDTYYELCDACGETWIYGTWSPQRAAAFRVALSLGRSWATAYRLADEYEGGYDVTEVDVRERRTPANKRPSAR